MLKMATQIETIVNTYKTFSKIPSIASGKLNKTGNIVTTNWSVRNLDRGRSTKYATTYYLNDSLNVVVQSEFGTDISNELLTAVSPNETYKAIIREEKNDKDVKKQYLEVWKKSTLAHCIDLTALDVHGNVYADSEFGNLDWNHDETKLVYVAERKLPKLEPYIKRNAVQEKPKCDECSNAGNSAPKKGEEFVYRQDWGEQLVGKYSSVIVVCTLADESVAVLDYLPADCCPGQVRFSPNGSTLVGVAWPTEPRRLGLVFCTNRPSFIFSLTLDGILTKLSAEGKAVRSPRFSSRSDLVWLQRAAGGPHHACHQIVIKRNGSAEPVPLIDIVETEMKIGFGESFYGVYCQALPLNCFSNAGGRLVFCTPQKNEVRSYVVDIDTFEITDISNKIAAGSTSILDVRSDVIVSAFSNLTTPGQLYIARLPSKGCEGVISWSQVSETADPAPVAPAHVEYLQMTHDSADGVNSFSAIYFAPKVEDVGKVPLIVWPHGGPHASFVNAYGLETAMFNSLGFASLLINYRGSTGAGDAFLRYLPGKAGDADVKDCKLATDVALAKFPISHQKVVLFGGSHGGFLVTHLSGQYPEVYKAVVSRNPVVDVATMFNYTDINDCYGGLVAGHLAAKYPDQYKAMAMRNPLVDLATKGHYADNSDGCAVEAGFEYTEKGPLSEEQLLLMRRCSPLAHVHKVRAPTAMMLGSGDKRVPHYQGLDYVRRLKANGVETRVYMYEDNHSLATQPAEMDNLINSAHWFLTHLD